MWIFCTKSSVVTPEADDNPLVNGATNIAQVLNFWKSSCTSYDSRLQAVCGVAYRSTTNIEASGLIQTAINNRYGGSK